MKRRPSPAVPPDDPSPVISRGGSAGSVASGAAPRCAAVPSPRARWLWSLFLIFHLPAMTLSLSCVIEHSETQASLLAWLHPYLRATRFGVDDRPIYLTHADRLEQPLRLQVADTLSPNEDDWRTIEPLGVPGLAGSDRYHRWLSTAVLLAETEQPGLVAELLLGFVLQTDQVRSVRVLQLPTELSMAAEDSPAPYVARVARSGDRVSLVHVPPTTQASVAVPRGGGDNQ